MTSTADTISPIVAVIGTGTNPVDHGSIADENLNKVNAWR